MGNTETGLNRSIGCGLNVSPRLISIILRLMPGAQRRCWTKRWTTLDQAPPPPWYLPDGVIPPQLHEVIESSWFSPGCRVLDVGCGRGAIAAYLARIGYNTRGIDFAAPAIQRARAAFAESDQLCFEVADICKFKAALPFDAILDRGCFHLVANQAAYVRAIQACSRAGARLLLATPIAYPAGPSVEQLEDKAEARLKEIRVRFEPAGFRVLRMQLAFVNARGDNDHMNSAVLVWFWMSRE